MPRSIVDRASPVARFTLAIPPCPNARASVAAHKRLDRSVSTGAKAAYFASNVSVFTHQRYTVVGRKSSTYFVTVPKTKHSLRPVLLGLRDEFLKRVAAL